MTGLLRPLLTGAPRCLQENDVKDCKECEVCWANVEFTQKHGDNTCPKSLSV